MVNRDFGYIISQLERKVAKLEKQIAKRKDFDAIASQDWDRATLMREWGVSPRTVCNYQKQGLTSYKRGGRVYYTAESREQFKSIKNKKYE